jgi:nitric oxide reductase NorE protein
MAPAGETSRLEARRLPGDSGVWLFIAADTFMFGLFFSSFMFERLKNVELFNQSQRALSPTVGAVNTLFLLAGSYFVVLAVDAAKQGMEQAVVNRLTLGIACGGAFAISKLFEYGAKFAAGISIVTNDYYVFYFVLTGVHFLHLCIGVIVLAILRHKARGGVGDGRWFGWLESGACYWHMVDLLWIMLFPLLYLVR